MSLFVSALCSSSTRVSRLNTVIFRPSSVTSKRKLTREQSSSTGASFQPPVKSVRISACAELYRKWSATRKAYRKAPANGIEFDVEYVDTIVPDKKQPVVLVLHGAPGSHAEYRSLTQHLSKLGFRVIVPNLPTYEATVKSRGIFRQSTEERTDFVGQFLAAIKVSEIDMIVAHSTGSYPAIKIWQDKSNFSVKSLTLINCSGHERMEVMKPAWLVDNFGRWHWHPVGRALNRALLPLLFYWLTTRAFTMTKETIEERALSFTIMLNSSKHLLPDYFRKLREDNVPFLFVLSYKDRLVHEGMIRDMIRILDTKEEHVRKYGSDGKMAKDWKHGNNFKVMCFESGGHYSFLKFSQQVNEAIVEVLNQLK
ncbi:hypothetical protein HDE_01134 [Halotydeus destructor]|nr:hypothetical protein HDE_01134 [Halotydeus destructor]